MVHQNFLVVHLYFILNIVYTSFVDFHKKILENMKGMTYLYGFSKFDEYPINNYFIMHMIYQKTALKSLGVGFRSGS